MASHGNRRAAPPSTALQDLVFWLIVAAVAAGVGAMMWSTATMGA